MSYRFHLAHSAYGGGGVGAGGVGVGGHGEPDQRETLLVSQPDRHQVIALRRIPRSATAAAAASAAGPAATLTEEEAENNWRPVVGTGESCLPGDGDRCGDGGKASEARLAYPKGTGQETGSQMCNWYC